MTKETLSIIQARRLALTAQGLAGPGVGTATAASPLTGRRVGTAMAALNPLQIDSVNVFARTHYLPVFSRHGVYDPAHVDVHAFEPTGGFIEYVAHEAALIPRTDWGLYEFRRTHLRHRYLERDDSWYGANQATVKHVVAQLEANGPLRASQIEQDRPARRGTWWDRPAVKRALELMWLAGDVVVAGRDRFERRYGLPHQVLAEPVLSATVSEDEARRILIERAARALGVATADDLADYHRQKVPAVRPIIGELEDSGVLVPVAVDGWRRGTTPLAAWRHRDATAARKLAPPTVLSPFDPLVWYRPRLERLFGMRYRIEIYTPAPQRIYGYYSLPVLVGDAIVGRVDLKAERKTSRLLVQSAWWEPGATAAEAAPQVAAALCQAAIWQQLDSISIAERGDAAQHLRACLPGAASH